MADERVLEVRRLAEALAGGSAEVTEADVRSRWGDEVADAAMALIRADDEPYVDYIMRIAANSLAREAKIMELTERLGTGEISGQDTDLLILTHALLTKVGAEKSPGAPTSVPLGQGSSQTTAYIHPIQDDLVVLATDPEEWVIVEQGHKDEVLLRALQHMLEDSSTVMADLQKWLDKAGVPYQYYAPTEGASDQL
ncbi:MAG: hypothetical protein ACRDJI_06825 [Actinomycetota bacterium]